MSPDEEYKLLPGSPIRSDDGPPTLRPKYRFMRATSHWLVVGLSLVILILLAALYRVSRQTYGQLCSQQLYSPAQDAIAYEAKTFYVPQNASFRSSYTSDPSDEVDQAWNDIYMNLGLSHISKNEAMRLPDKTAPYPEDPSKYVVILSVFHQLHCLNILRKVYHSDYYADPLTGNIGITKHSSIPDHVAHCLDILRQGIMCAADISPIVYDWDEERQKTIPMLSIGHSCRKWDNIVDWARDHQL
ncbi:hypothetical protein NM688_g2066 [Phlebia brevispora]|uniref:Uncharacterized protein n=1 Tax=Phlebia brevispora TaxID=194682 RepID=A0ACC1T9B1_9APHY|nr:hypothetical protein NM688_g2066 [Phlebia brevispora]